MSILRRLGRNAHWHWQNLDEARDPAGTGYRTKGRGWRHGRAWLSVGASDERRYPSRPYDFGVEWVLGRGGHWNVLSLRAALGEGDTDQELAGHLEIAGVAVYGHALTPLTRRATAVLCRRRGPSYGYGREVRLRVDERLGIWWALWGDPHGWSSRMPRWRDGHFDPADFLLGRHRYEREVLLERAVEIPMPERSYPATVTITEARWIRTRLGWPRRRLLRAEIEIPGGVPVPGKGENAWDCGEDAIYSLTTPADTICQAIGILVGDALRQRERYGGQAWRPSVGVPS